MLATLAVIAATQPVRVEDISTIEGEDDTGTPRRDITLSGRDIGYKVWRHSSNAGGPVRSAVRGSDRGTESSISVAHQGYRSGRRSGAAAGQSGRAAGRDLRRSRPAEQLNWCASTAPRPVRDERRRESVEGYRSMPAGTYVVVTNRVRRR